MDTLLVGGSVATAVGPAALVCTSEKDIPRSELAGAEDR